VLRSISDHMLESHMQDNAVSTNPARATILIQEQKSGSHLLLAY
jgi:hypothetical protein